MAGVGLWSVLAALLFAGAAVAQPKPGEIIGPANADRVADYVSPGVLWLVRDGMSMRIIPAERSPDPPAYRDATEKYSSQVRLRPDGSLDESTYVAGRPFPVIDPNHPLVALKVIYDVERNRYFTDDLDASHGELEGGTIHGGSGSRSFKLESRDVVDHFRVLRYVGRTEQAPVPRMPNPLRLLQRSGIYPWLEPYDLKGFGGVGYRYLDPARPQDTWIYTPNNGRVRRLNEVGLSEPFVGKDLDPDSVGGFGARIQLFEWRLLAVKPMLASVHAESFPPVPCEGDGGATFCDAWELRPKVYVLEGKSRSADYAYSKRILFVDGESFLVPFTDLFDHHGELWKVLVNYYRHSTRPKPGVPIWYPFERDFLSAASTVDVQFGHATRLTIPDSRFPKDPAWTINAGDSGGVTEDWFTLEALTATGR